MRKILTTVAIGLGIGAALALAACGTTKVERAATGGLLGAGTGAAIGSLSGNAGTGAVIGGVVGAVAGAATDPCKVNLEDPIWKDKNANHKDYYRRCGHYPQ